MTTRTRRWITDDDERPIASPKQIARIRQQLWTIRADEADLDCWLIATFGTGLHRIDPATASGLVLIFDRYIADMEASPYRRPRSYWQDITS